MDQQTKNSVVDNILNVLEGAKFEDWYKTKFNDYICDGVYLEITKEQIKQDIVKLFHLE